MQAIRDTGNALLAAFDPNDSVGILDSYFPEADFFTEFERFDRFLDARRQGGAAAVDYVSICSPNYLHRSHIRYALRSGANAICEKPIVLEPADLDELIAVEAASQGRVSTVLQLRVHPALVALRERLGHEPQDRKHEVDLTYITSRGRWYFESWKGDERRSGGIATNIGVHFFDMLHFLFGRLQDNLLHLSQPDKAGGYLEFERARVRWFLSLDVMDVPEAQRAAGQRTYRSITLDGEEIEFSGGFTDLHTRTYQEILAGRGFGLEENRTAIEAVAHIRHAVPNPSRGERHPLVQGAGA
jgi:UDP-N-acetyl-2-amino-2-deoxyglucuronate dehydrogenase